MKDRLQRDYTFTILPEHLLRDRAISDRAVRLWCLLERESHKGEESVPCPRRAEMAEWLDCSKESASRCVRELEKKGWMEVDRIAPGDANIYTLTIPDPRSYPLSPMTTPLVTSDNPGHPRQDPLSPMTTPLVTSDNYTSLRDLERTTQERTTCAARPRDEVWDALLDACKITGDIPKSARGAYNKAVSDLRAINATPEEIYRRATCYRETWPNASLTPTALVRRWNEIAQRPTPPLSPNMQKLSLSFERAQEMDRIEESRNRVSL